MDERESQPDESTHELSVTDVPPVWPSPPVPLLAPRARREMMAMTRKPRNWAMKSRAKVRSFHLEREANAVSLRRPRGQQRLNSLWLDRVKLLDLVAVVLRVLTLPLASPSSAVLPSAVLLLPLLLLLSCPTSLLLPLLRCLIRLSVILRLHLVLWLPAMKSERECQRSFR